MKLGLKASIEYKYGNYEQMRAIVPAYSSHRECSMQEELYHCF